jgi:hypothetical protein
LASFNNILYESPNKTSPEKEVSSRAVSDKGKATPDNVQKAYDTEFQNIKDISAKISELCKYIWAGSLATFFALITAQQNTRAFDFYSASKTIIFAAAIFGSLAFLFDYLQYVSGLVQATKVKKWFEGTTDPNPADFGPVAHSLWTKANFVFFCAKNAFAALAAISMIIAISMLYCHTL